MNGHPARPVRTLTDAHRLGKCGLDAIFKPGSKWHYFKADNPVVIVSVKAAYQHKSLVNHSARPEDVGVKGQPSWFIDCGDGSGGYPPHTLIPHDVVVAEQACACKAPQPAPTAKELHSDLERARMDLNDRTKERDEYQRIAASTRDANERLTEQLRIARHERAEALRRAADAEDICRLQASKFRSIRDIVG